MSVIALAALAAACGDDGGVVADAPLAVDAAAIDAARFDAGTGPVAAAEPCAAQACGPARVVTSAAELVTLLDGLQPWPDEGRLASGCVSPTVDIEVHGTITLDIAALARPPGCGPSCLPRIDVRTTRASCVESGDGGAGRCQQARIADATVRLLPYIYQNGPPLPEPTVALIDSCAATSCGTDERMCAANQVCWLDRAAQQIYEEPTRQHCRYCLGLPWQQCACWDGERAVADGTSCVFWLSGDVAGFRDVLRGHLRPVRDRAAA